MDPFRTLPEQNLRSNTPQHKRQTSAQVKRTYIESPQLLSNCVIHQLNKNYRLSTRSTTRNTFRTSSFLQTKAVRCRTINSSLPTISRLEICATETLSSAGGIQQAPQELMGIALSRVRYILIALSADEKSGDASRRTCSRSNKSLACCHLLLSPMYVR